jgi:hypothetical protein
MAARSRAVGRLHWSPVIEAARRFVLAQPVPPDLRDVHYHLAGRQLVPNRRQSYSYLSELTAPMRRAGTFPELSEDLSRRIDRPLQWDDPEHAREWLREHYRIDRTIGQEVSLYLVVEKNGMVPRLRYWFDDLSIPVVGLKGISSATLETKVNGDIARQQRPAVALYFGDFDPTGVFIDQDFERHTSFAKFIRLGVNSGDLGPVDQVERFGLLESITPQTEKDTRTPAFIRRFGRVRQVEMNAMPFDLIERLYREAVAQWWNPDAYQAAREREDAERDDLARAVLMRHSADDLHRPAATVRGWRLSSRPGRVWLHPDPGGDGDLIPAAAETLAAALLRAAVEARRPPDRS